jgi:methylated-DNA-[protein]-cysteine S-methyltransferase
MSLIFYTTIESPVGPLLLASNERGLRRVSFENSKRTTPLQPDWKRERGPFTEVIRQLRAYFLQ